RGRCIARARRRVAEPGGICNNAGGGGGSSMPAATYRDGAARARAYGAVAADWAHQVNAFRESVASFQRVIQRQARRRAERRPAGLAMRVPRAAPRLAVANGRMLSGGVDGLPPRQQDSLALQVRGWTHRQHTA